jgi:hypothetical protein
VLWRFRQASRANNLFGTYFSADLVPKQTSVSVARWKAGKSEPGFYVDRSLGDLGDAAGHSQSLQTPRATTPAFLARIAHERSGLDDPNVFHEKACYPYLFSMEYDSIVN